MSNIYFWFFPKWNNLQTKSFTTNNVAPQSESIWNLIQNKGIKLLLVEIGLWQDGTYLTITRLQVFKEGQKNLSLELPIFGIKLEFWNFLQTSTEFTHIVSAEIIL